jgi:hypothetical protein
MPIDKHLGRSSHEVELAVDKILELHRLGAEHHVDVESLLAQRDRAASLIEEFLRTVAADGLNAHRFTARALVRLFEPARPTQPAQ